VTNRIYKVEDLERPFYIQDFQNSSHLIMALSGYGQNFEWFGSLKRVTENYTFSKFWLRDTSKAYWHGELPGIDIGVINLAKFISGKIKESEAKKVMMMGLSMGGYGALLLGCLCNVDLVLSFSGQTYLPDHRRVKYKLYEKWKNIKVLEENIDLKILFDKHNKNNKTVYKLFYGDENVGDKKYAKHIEKHRGVELFPVNTNKHNTAGPIINSGLFDKLIKDFLEE